MNLQFDEAIASHYKNISQKIRRQLQFLRDKGFIEFIGRGIYRKTN